jgi:heterodisulfide reductase subunit A
MADRIDVGTIVVATGFEEADLSGRYGYGQHPDIITQAELEQRLQAGTVGTPRNVVMLNCAGSMDDTNPSCCRIGCGVSVKNAKMLKQAVPGARVYMLYQDMRMFGKREEEYFSHMLETVRPGTIRYTADQLPAVSMREGQIVVTVFDALLQQDVEIEADMLVLTAATRGDADTPRLKKMLKISANAEHFYAEAHAKIRPLDFATDGIYLCGAAHYPKNIPDTIAQAEGAASRAAIPIMLEKVSVAPAIAEIDEAICSGCGLCVSLCPYNAISLDGARRVAAITDVMCKGCGTCVAACPSGASQQRNFTDQQLMAMIDAAWEV